VTAFRATAVAGACLVAVWIASGVPAGASTPDGSTGSDVTAEGTLAAAGEGSGAVTYNPALAPEGARLSVAVADDGEGGTTVTLDVEGLLPDRSYAAHAHVKPCGATGADAGPHFQNTADPAAGPDKPSTDPAYANPENEVWLDLHTDGDGDAHAEADVPFVFAENRSPRSVVIHEGEMTATDAGHAGTAGGRAACITLPTS
jgi:superoxide dismutase, Cu-Zn family